MNNQDHPFFNLGSTNSDEGIAWEELWCDNCYRDKFKCSILISGMGGID